VHHPVAGPRRRTERNDASQNALRLVCGCDAIRRHRRERTGRERPLPILHRLPARVNAWALRSTRDLSHLPYRVAATPVVRQLTPQGLVLWCDRLDPDRGRIVLGESLAVRVTHGDDLLDALIRQQCIDRVRAQVELLRERVRLTALRAGRAVRSERDEAL